MHEAVDLTDLIEQNMKMLENGITLQEYREKEEQIKIGGDTSIYDEFGFYVVHNKTKNLYLLDGGSNPSFTMSVAIPQFFITNDGCGNPYMHKHYMDGDKIVLTYWRYDDKKYKTMEQLKKHIESYYDSIGETYYDFIMRMQDSSYTKQKRPKGYNSYYNGKPQKKTQEKEQGVTQKSNRNRKTKSAAAALLRLENKSKFLYDLLNAIVDLLIKPLPIFVWLLFKNGGHLLSGENAVQHFLFLVVGILGYYIYAVEFYVIFLVIVQIIRFFVCEYKPLVIYFRVFDIIIKLSREKILNRNDRELEKLFYEHEQSIKERKAKRATAKRRAQEKGQERKEQRKIQDLEFAQKEYERMKTSAQINRDTAEYNLKQVRKGDTLFSSAEESRRAARKYSEYAENDEQQARYYEKRIRAKERSLGIEHED